MLSALVGGGALTAADLARVGGVAASTASAHLATLVAAGLVRVRPVGRQRVHVLAGPDVARAVEALQALAPPVPVRSLRGARIAADLVAGRTCYDHLAGELGLRLTDLLVARGVVAPLEPGAVHDHLGCPDDPVALGLRLGAVTPGRRALVRGCLDWSGRRAHLAGALGAHVLTELRGRDWVRPRPGSRAVRLTEAGEAGLRALGAA